ncbi:hypothetical protein CKY05_17840 [Photorhabdus sp. S10-54]|nr:hypothetical protein CKY05_17840 [Photorhabdus sp. S10-54]
MQNNIIRGLQYCFLLVGGIQELKIQSIVIIKGNIFKWQIFAAIEIQLKLTTIIGAMRYSQF